MMTPRTDLPPLTVSFEFFPPKTEASEAALWRAVDRLAPLAPAFVSVTYGAGGSTRERTHQIVTQLQGERGLSAAAHLTCVGASRDEIDAIARHYWDSGIRHLVALRGDPPAGADRYVPHPEGYAYALDLIAGLKKVADFEISVAAYPEAHPEAPSADFDLQYLKAKLAAGATRAISQFFFDPEVFLRFRDRCDAAGIAAPIVPGLLPVSNFKTAARFAKMCGAAVPAWLADQFDGLDDDAETRNLVAAWIAAEQVNRLRAEGVGHIHFYTLNRSDLTYALCHILGVRPPAIAEAAAE